MWEKLWIFNAWVANKLRKSSPKNQLTSHLLFRKLSLNPCYPFQFNLWLMWKFLFDHIDVKFQPQERPYLSNSSKKCKATKLKLGGWNLLWNMYSCPFVKKEKEETQNQLKTLMAEQRQLTSASADRAISAVSTEKMAMTFLRCPCGVKRNFNYFTHLSVHSSYFILKRLCKKNGQAGICFDCHSLGMLCLILTDDPGGLEG